MKRDVKQDGAVQSFMPTKLTFALFAVYTVLIALFLFLLDKKTQQGFGFVDIMFAIIAAFLWVTLLSWIKTIMRKNPYLGLIIGLVVIVLLANALFIRYKGPNTLIFAGIGTLITVGDLIYQFFAARSAEAKALK